MTTLQKARIQGCFMGSCVINSNKYRDPQTQSHWPQQPGFTYNGSTAPRPHPGWLCCTHTVCNENEDTHRYLGSSPSLAVKASSGSAEEQSPGPRHEEDQPPPILRASAAPRSRDPLLRGLHLGPPPLPSLGARPGSAAAPLTSSRPSRRSPWTPAPSAPRWPPPR